jgi:Cd2+/Zn2+-exporting ATPase
VVLLNDDLEKTAFAIRLSICQQLIRQNVVFSLGLRHWWLCWLLLGLTPLWVQFWQIIVISLIVTFNGMRALQFEPTSQLSAT